MSGTATIYLSLLDEGVDVRPPVQAEHIDGKVYLIVNQPYERGSRARSPTAGAAP